MALLEESVHLLYREWFVHLRFPGHEHVKIVDGVPEGWRRVQAREVIDFNPRTQVSKDVETPYVPMDSISTSSMAIGPIETRIPKGGAKFMDGDTLFARITPCLENGKTGFVNFLEKNAAATGSTAFTVLRGKQVPNTFVYALARSDAFRATAINNMSGADGRQRVRNDAVEQFGLLLPPPLVIEEWSAFAGPVFEQHRSFREQNLLLSEARDALLPRLMNGSIKV